MKNVFLTPILSLVIVLGFAQTPQIALVKPNGTTTIHTTFDAAYTAATDDDYIYLPGGTFSSDLPTVINKRLYITGAGMNVDSSNVTGITRIPYLTFHEGASGSRIEGIYFYSGASQGTIVLNNQSSNSTNNFTIINCNIAGAIHSTNNFWENVTIAKSVLMGSLQGNFSNSYLSNNHIYSHLNVNGLNFQIDNNIFFYQPHPNSYLTLPNNSTFRNNIFQLYTTPFYISLNSIFHNNTNIVTNGSTQIFNQIQEPFLDAFLNPGSESNNIWCTCNVYNYDIHNDYHIKPTSECKNSGTDGTDRGVYGGAFPWVDGSIPSNPHIYYKNVAGSTNASGQLQVQYKVKTGN